MFTGIIQAVGSVNACRRETGDMVLNLDTGKMPMQHVQLGDSIAVNGVCLTVVRKSDRGFDADVSAESLQRTTLGEIQIGSRVNLEQALTPTTHLGGHIVSGHVDGVGAVLKRWSDGRSERFRFEVPQNLARYIAEKGSICIDGISLTVNSVENNTFEVNIVPHTLQETTMGEFKPGRKVNLEVDIIARYLERLIQGGVLESKDAGQGITQALLAQHGFIKPV
ncbi:MAG: riboflavin synthase [Gammaproteobacteria bacterium]|nr:riboflavin synthase [Gammaproteobacteria bacterium]MDH5799316.1 riboflavin synthase [Gammaproteobacteria bacterium]